MDEGLYFGSSPESSAEITIDCRNTDKPNGFEIGQPGKGSGFNSNPLPSGVAAAVQDELKRASVKADITVDPARGYDSIR